MAKNKHNRIHADQNGNSERDFFKWQQNIGTGVDEHGRSEVD